MKTIYISGKITGRPREEAERQFAGAEETLRTLGYNSYNPLHNGLPVDSPWEEHLAADVLALLECGGIVLLSGWETSVGARLERAVAGRKGIPVVPLEELQSKFTF